MPIALHVLYQEAVWLDKIRRVLWHVDYGPFNVSGCITDNYFLDARPQLCRDCNPEGKRHAFPRNSISCQLREVLPLAVIEPRRKLTFPKALFKIYNSGRAREGAHLRAAV